MSNISFIMLFQATAFLFLKSSHWGCVVYAAVNLLKLQCKEDACEQFSWTGTVCKQHGIVTSKGLLGFFVKANLKEASFAAAFTEICRKQEIRGLWVKLVFLSML